MLSALPIHQALSWAPDIQCLSSCNHHFKKRVTVLKLQKKKWKIK